MKAAHIYLNKEGIPCAPVNHLPSKSDHWGNPDQYTELYNEVKQTAIPIIDEDRDWCISAIGVTPCFLHRDTLYAVWPYSFSIKEIIGPGWVPTYSNPDNSNFDPPAEPMDVACIIHSPEPKADPKEKELYSIKELEWVTEEFDSQRARPFDYGDKYSGPYYTVYKETFGENWYWGWSKDRVSYPVSTEYEAKQKCADHFNSKLKLCLNREL